MDQKALKAKLGRWLQISELYDALTEMPPEIFEKTPFNRNMLETASKFVENQCGRWEHPDWEAFLNLLENEGHDLSDQGKASVGNILEIFKQYYHKDEFQTVIDKRRKPSTPRKPHTNKAKANKKNQAKIPA